MSWQFDLIQFKEALAEIWQFNKLEEVNGLVGYKPVQNAHNNWIVCNSIEELILEAIFSAFRFKISTRLSD